MFNYLERTVLLNSRIVLSDRGTMLTDKTRPERFKGSIAELKIEYYEPEIIYNEDGQFSFKEKPLIRNHNNPIQRTINYKNNKKISDRTKTNDNKYFPDYIYKYDFEKDLIQIIMYDKELNSPFEIFTFKYNRQNQLISKNYSQPGMGNNGWEDEYIYDENGLLIKEIWHNKGNDLLFTYKYDPNGKLVEKIGQTPNYYSIPNGYIDGYPATMRKCSQFSDNEILYKMKIDYFKNNKIKSIEKKNSELISFGIEEEEEIEIHNYEENGYKTISKSSNSKFKTENSKTTFNQNGEIVYFEDYNNNNNNSKWTYKYDDKLNWIYCVQYRAGKPVLIIRRIFN